MEEKKYEYCYKSTAISLLGLSPKNFERLHLEPDKIVRNPHYSSASPSLLYKRDRIEKLVNTPEVLALQSKPRKPKDWAALFVKRYSTPAQAQGDVADAMFNLNRYAKHETCAARNRAEIYHLKERLIERFLQFGLCSSVALHIQKLQKQSCWGCAGTGLWADKDTGELDNCQQCRGSGVYNSARELKFYIFSFQVGSKNYSWHQPYENVKIKLEVTSEVTSKWNESEARPLTMPQRKLAEAKTLVRWFLEDNL